MHLDFQVDSDITRDVAAEHRVLIRAVNAVDIAVALHVRDHARALGPTDETRERKTLQGGRQQSCKQTPAV